MYISESFFCHTRSVRSQRTFAVKTGNPEEISSSVVFIYFSKKFKSNILKILKITITIINIQRGDKTDVLNC